MYAFLHIFKKLKIQPKPRIEQYKHRNVPYIYDVMKFLTPTNYLYVGITLGRKWYYIYHLDNLRTNKTPGCSRIYKIISARY